MQRRRFLKTATAGLAMTAMAAPAIAQSPDKVRWRMATSWPKSLDTIYGSADEMCKRVGQLTDGKFEIQCFAAGEIVPAAAGVRRGLEQDRPMRSHAVIVLFRQGPGLCLRFRRGLWRQCAPAGLLALLRRRPRADARDFRQAGHAEFPLRQCRRADGRLVSQGDQYAGRHEGPSHPHRRPWRRGVAAARQRADADRARRYLRRRSSAARSMRPNGSARTTTRSSDSTRSRKYYYTPGWWEGSAMITSSRQRPGVEGAAAAITRTPSRRLRMSRTC